MRVRLCCGPQFTTHTDVLCKNMITAYSTGNERSRDEAIHRLRTELLTAEETLTLWKVIEDWNEVVRLFRRPPVNDNTRRSPPQVDGGSWGSDFFL
jgi:hypothetical protein